MQRLNIAVDGPAGAGKSTVAKAVAARLNIKYLDTGAMYRGIALYITRRGVNPTDGAAVEKALPDADIRVIYTDAGQRVLLSGEDVTGLLRTPALSRAASDVSAHPCVRLYLTEMQRQVAREYDVIMDGRDIGTNVLKDTPDKFFLTADLPVRAYRRWLELSQKDPQADLKSVEKEMGERDYNDSHRAFMPLKQADDAELIDTSDLSAEEVTERIVSAVLKRYPEREA